MHSMTNTRHDNNVTDHTSVISVEYNVELLRPIKHCVVRNMT